MRFIEGRLQINSPPIGPRCLHASGPRAPALDGLGCDGGLVRLRGSVVFAPEDVRLDEFPYL